MLENFPKKTFDWEYVVVYVGLYLVSLKSNYWINLSFLKSSRTSFESTQFSLFNPFVYYLFYYIYSSKASLFNVLLKPSLSRFSILITDLRYFVYKKFLQHKPLSVKAFLKVEPRRLYRYESIVIRIDLTSYPLMRSYVEHYRLFKYNEYRLIVQIKKKN